MASARPQASSRLACPSSACGPGAAAAWHTARRLADKILVTNDASEHAVLSPGDYDRYLSGKLDGPLSETLAARGFLRDKLDFGDLATRAVRRHLLDWPGPNVHTIVATRRCNLKCVYCHASVGDESRSDLDMTLETARQTVDLIFQSGHPELMIEFQGGEPLLNWPVVKFIVEYARKKNELHGKVLHFGLISNFVLLDDEKLDWLAERGVSFCTSLDGPPAVHDKNRVSLGGGSHAQVVDALKRIGARLAAGRKLDKPNAICTVTRHSLGRAREIVDQSVDLGLERIQLGPLDPIGYARRSWESIGISSDEFLAFYREALERILELNAQGVKVYEKTGLIFMIRVLEGGHWRFPNADGVARLAYNHDGAIYVSEEGRLLGNEGDHFFRIGRVSESTLTGLLDHPTVRAVLLAASPDTQPQCFHCAYRPFCTIAPVYNYAAQGSLWGHMPTGDWCRRMMGLFDLYFEKLQRPKERRMLESWLEYKSR